MPDIVLEIVGAENDDEEDAEAVVIDMHSECAASPAVKFAVRKL